jgi:hypothetical protein
MAPYRTLLPEEVSQREHSLRGVFNGLRYIIMTVTVALDAQESAGLGRPLPAGADLRAVVRSASRCGQIKLSLQVLPRAGRPGGMDPGNLRSPHSVLAPRPLISLVKHYSTFSLTTWERLENSSVWQFKDRLSAELDELEPHPVASALRRH